MKVLAVNCCVVLVLLMQLWGPVAAGPLPQSSVDYLIIPYEEASPDTSNDGYRNNQPSVLTSFNYGWPSDNNEYFYVPVGAHYTVRTAGQNMKRGTVESVRNVHF